MAHAKLPRLSHPPEQQCYQLRLSARFLPQSVIQIRSHSASFGGFAALRMRRTPCGSTGEK